MIRLPNALEILLHELRRLPGVGRRAAERLALHLLEAPAEDAAALARAIEQLRQEVRTCSVCGNFTDGELCSICSDERRATGQLCVVEKPSDLWAFEQAEAYRGRYHVLGGTLSPLAGVTADDLRIAELEQRIELEQIKEIILATNPSVDGDATAIYLAHRLAPMGLKVTRIAQGVPLGGHLDYADAGTLRLALDGRRPVE
ncbi:MAG: recombination mediator RecR [Candidatus Sumerlaeia bacterium]